MDGLAGVMNEGEGEEAMSRAEDTPIGEVCRARPHAFLASPPLCKPDDLTGTPLPCKSAAL